MCCSSICGRDCLSALVPDVECNKVKIVFFSTLSIIAIIAAVGLWYGAIQSATELASLNGRVIDLTRQAADADIVSWTQPSSWGLYDQWARIVYGTLPQANAQLVTLQSAHLINVGAALGATVLAPLFGAIAWTNWLIDSHEEALAMPVADQTL